MLAGPYTVMKNKGNIFFILSDYMEALMSLIIPIYVLFADIDFKGLYVQVFTEF